MAEDPAATPPTAAGDPDAERYKRVGKMSALYLAGAFVSKLAKFLLVPFYVRYLTKAEVGTVVFLDALILALARLFPLGLNQAVKRFYPEVGGDRDGDRFTFGIWAVVLGFGAAGAGLAWAAAPVWTGAVAEAIPAGFLVLAVAIAGLQGNAAVPTTRFVARQQPLAHTAYTTAQFILVTACIVVGVGVLGRGVEGVLWGQLAAYVAWTVLAGVLLGRWAGWRPSFSRVGASLAFSVAVVPHLLFTWGITFADRLILVRYVSLEAVGVYGVGYQIGSLITIFSLSVTNAWLARFFRASEGDAGADEFAQTLTRMTLVLLALSLATFALAPELIAVAATSAYADSVPILRMIAAAHVFHGLNQAFILPLFLKKRTGLVSASTGFGLVVNVGLNVLLIPRYGITGAAVATIASYVGIAVSSYVFARGVYPVRIEGARLGLASGLALALGAGAMLLPDLSLIHTLGRLALVAAFPAVLWAWPGGALLTPADRAAALAIPRRLRRRLG
ncbi:lipopolysaccharide biosynthesis protein [Rubrivirga sp. IMCC45206]|uniref:lipopolysaccharide biosynthesis protein n=1 Tax=Rubrivirga sp. IMCC45206 TaxID=3391614 RepID=UPI0039902480